MPSQMSVRAVYQQGMHFIATASEHSVSLDYPLQPGPTAGAKPLELLLASLAACAGGTMALLLNKTQQPVRAMEVLAKAQRRDEHPTVLNDITLEFVIRGTGVDPSAVERALAQAEEKVCPVWAMLKGGTRITATFRLVPE